MDKEIINIINEEILYLIYGIFQKESIREENIRKILEKSDQATSEEDLQKIITNIRNRTEFVRDAFDIDALEKRYQLKKESIHAKLSGFQYNVCSSKLSNGEKTSYAVLSISSKKRLRPMQGNAIDFLISDREIEHEVSFICDREDLELLIHHLEIVKRTMEE